MQTKYYHRNLTWIFKKEDSKEYKNDFLELMKQRHRNVKVVCAQMMPLNQSHDLQSSHIYWMQKQNIAYCPSFKSATTTWFNILIKLTNHSEAYLERVRTELNRKWAPIPAHLRYLGAINPDRKEWSDYVSSLNHNHNLTGFMVVRHPFDRMVSAYRDKLERNNAWFQKLYGQPFVSKYRQQAVEVLGIDFFNETNNFGTVMKVPKNGRRSSQLPSFWEFAQSVIDRYKMNVHWVPITEFCSICDPLNIKAFKYFLKFENLDHEEMLFVNENHWETTIAKTEKLNKNWSGNLYGNDLTRLYFSILSDQQINKLYEFYKQDFLLFKYKFEINNLTFPS